MDFVAVKCPGCGKALDVDASLDRAFCMYCGQAFAPKHVQKIEGHTEGTANPQSQPAMVMMKKAEDCLKIGDKDNFTKFTLKAIEIDPLNPYIRWQFMLNRVSYYEGSAYFVAKDSLLENSYTNYSRWSENIKSMEEKLKTNFLELTELCNLDPANKGKYIKSMACKEAQFLYKTLEKGYNNIRADKLFAKSFSGEFKKKDLNFDTWDYWRGLQGVQESLLPGIARTFKLEMANELKRINTSLYDLIKDRLLY
ncbi:MAG: hypothetical protein FWF44_02230 [Defluviitaleaceae bacterium]|nr:hypothetical protein [Defluviitaleaceae bacterium]